MDPFSDVATLDDFLAGIQHRAFAMAKVATGHESDAMDIVQDAMMQLVKYYSERASDEWRMLFYRILHNRINDYFRRRKIRAKITGWLPGSFRDDAEADKGDPFQQVAGAKSNEPDKHLEREQNISQLHIALQSLSRRQREAFMLRCWEGLSTGEAAAAMRCSEGSVKTHYSRAMASLRGLLEKSNHETRV